MHRVASLSKRWLLGTHQGAVNVAHLPSYLDEFMFRFNRRHSCSRGLVFYPVLELAVDTRPCGHHEVIATSVPARSLPSRRRPEYILPASTDRPPTAPGEPVTAQLR